jgi:hypothetical protein
MQRTILDLLISIEGIFDTISNVMLWLSYCGTYIRYFSLSGKKRERERESGQALRDLIF